MPFALGAYVLDEDGEGIRRYPYTTNLTVNPETYAFINNASFQEAHSRGEVWATILWEVYWSVVDTYGFVNDYYFGNGGNNQIVKNVIDGMKLQPCYPNFVTARDAILTADKVNHGGRNVCRMWKAFAKRGVGVNAVPGAQTGVTRVVEDFQIPPEC